MPSLDYSVIPERSWLKACEDGLNRESIIKILDSRFRGNDKLVIPALAYTRTSSAGMTLKKYGYRLVMEK